ncbi:FixH family protein [Nonomuraea fuscirosea]|uniref:FixH family protein n=1 Tax=Nonomuraea fuscirosea TaxID=1291556 RepID=UPI002DDB0973|nr:FixH family protein [Nonomuraea fuscirosea]WSA48478.1 FixH family protein [Nonomuraea fuscirosea]
MAVGLTACGSSGPTATYAVHLSVDRPRTGANTFDIEVEGRKGGTLTEVGLEPVMPQMGHAYPPVTATPLGAGRFRAAGTVLTMPGMWRITVTVRGANGAEQAVFPLVVGRTWTSPRRPLRRPGRSRPSGKG